MAQRFTKPLMGLRSALTDPMNLSHQAADEAGAFYRNANSIAQPNAPSVLEQAINMGQAAQATDYSDTQGFKGFMQALKERDVALSPRSGFQGTGNPAMALAGLSQKRKK